MQIKTFDDSLQYIARQTIILKGQPTPKVSGVQLALAPLVRVCVCTVQKENAHDLELHKHHFLSNVHLNYILWYVHIYNVYIQ